MKKIAFIGLSIGAILYGGVTITSNTAATSVSGAGTGAVNTTLGSASGSGSGSASTSGASGSATATVVVAKPYLFKVGDNLSPFTIGTKIANKSFTLTIVNSESNINAGDINFSIFDMNTGKMLSPWKQFNAMLPTKTETFKIPEISKNARVGFKVCASYDDSTHTYKLYNYSECPATDTLDSCNKTGDKSLRMCYSDDNFAIMPYRFEINATADANGVYTKFKALDYEGNVVKDYNESVGDTFDVTYGDTKKYWTPSGYVKCATGKFDHNSKDINESWSFADGRKNLDLNYSETGNVEISIKDKDKCADRFNAVDCKDYGVAPASDKLAPKIKDSNITVFIPINHFDADFTLHNFEDADFTYLANNISEMNATIDVKVSARNYKDEIATNYYNKCYAKDVNATFTHNVLNSYFSKVNTSSGAFGRDDNLTFDVSADKFKTPTTLAKFYFNLNRKYDKAVEPQEFTITDALVTNSDKVKSKNSFSSNAMFRYGYFDYAKNSCAYAKSLTIRVMYEYYEGGRFIPSQGHTSDMGDIKAVVVSSKISTDISQIDPIGREYITYTYDEPTPYSTISHLDIPEYLWFSAEGDSYVAPDSNHLDCRYHPCQKITFYSSSEGWGGSSAKNAPEKYKANENTSNIRVFKEANVSKHPPRRIMW